MSFDPFPEHADPQKLFTRNGTVSGAITLTKLVRLSASLGDEEENEGASINAELHFSRSDSNLPLVSGVVKTEVKIKCQRCLSMVPLALTAEIDVVLVRTEEAGKALANNVEWIHVDIEDFDVMALIEDELIMSLPIVSNHDNESCNSELSVLRDAVESLSKVKESPFAALEAMKNELKQ